MDARIAEVAERQHGIVGRRQLLELGIGHRAIVHRVQRGRLRVLYRGVYAVGHRVLSTRGHWMAAVIASGPCAVLSHRAAAALWELSRYEHLEVTVPHPRRARPGIQIHHSPLPDDEVTIENGIPVTTVPRTLLDLAAVLPRSQVERALNEAEIRQRTDPLSLLDLIDRHPHRPGIRVIRTLLADLRSGGTITRSELESRFREFAGSRNLPPGELNLPLFAGGRWFECDCVWRAQRLILELDGRAVHATAAAFERDRERDRMLSAEGWRVVRITWHQLHREPERVAADLRKVLLG
jgi:hypothetical protein